MKINTKCRDTQTQQRRTMIMATMTPKRPKALPKISIIRTLTNNVLFCASASAPPDPTTPTHSPHARLLKPATIPALNIMNPAPRQHQHHEVSPSQMKSTLNCSTESEWWAMSVCLHTARGYTGVLNHKWHPWQCSRAPFTLPVNTGRLDEPCSRATYVRFNGRFPDEPGLSGYL